jgi:CHAD domain-containing protein
MLRSAALSEPVLLGANHWKAGCSVLGPLGPCASWSRMKLELDHIEKPLRKLRKQLNAFPENPRPEDVHSLRTQTRRLEATLTALVLDRSKGPRRLIKAITPVRKAAGKVRDMDVLIGDVLTLADSHESEGLVRLVEHLAKMRVKSARKLYEVVNGKRKEARKGLKHSSKLIERTLKEDSSAANGEAAPQILINELSHWPNLDETNLHTFRIRIKELRYTLQLSKEADAKLVDQLGDVRDAIGEWHDWIELRKIANKVLDPDSEGEVLLRIEEMGKKKFELALEKANQVRERYFTRATGRAASKKVIPMAAGF